MMMGQGLDTGLQETANFAAQMNKSTGLPVGMVAVKKSLERDNPLKQSFATTVSVLGNPGAAAPSIQKTLVAKATRSPKAPRRVGSTYVGGATISQRMS